MNAQDLASWIIISVAVAWVINFLGLLAGGIADSIRRSLARRRRMALHRRWVAARVAAREETEARLRAEGRWDNFEVQDAMKAAGDRVDPNYRP